MNIQDLPASPASRVSPNQRISRTKHGPFKGHPNLPKTINNLHVYAQKQKKAHRPTLTPPHSTKKNYVNECVNAKQI